MRVWLRIPIVLVILFSAASFIWFLLGATAFFQRGIDIIGTTYFWGAGVSILLISVMFTILIIKGWTPSSGIQYVGICVGLVLTVLISVALIQSVNTHGWAKETIRSDTLKISADGRYEYRIDLINLFQRNSHARLYLKNVSTREEIYIPTEIESQKIKGLAVGKGRHWVNLVPTDNATLYILSTTKDLPIPEERFEINIREGTSRRME